MFANHGVPLRQFGEWLALDECGPAVRGQAVFHERRGDGVLVQLDVLVATTEGRVLFDSYAVPAPSVDQALPRLYEKFCANALHTLLVAFFDRPVDVHADVEAWSVGGEPFVVTSGGVTFEA